MLCTLESLHHRNTQIVICGWKKEERKEEKLRIKRSSGQCKVDKMLLDAKLYTPNI